MSIANRDRFPDVDWLPESEIRQVGTIGGMPLVLLGFQPGFEEGQKLPVVARSYTSDPKTEELSPIAFETLMNSQEPIEITEKLEAS